MAQPLNRRRRHCRGILFLRLPGGRRNCGLWVPEARWTGGGGVDSGSLCFAGCPTAPLPCLLPNPFSPCGKGKREDHSARGAFWTDARCASSSTQLMQKITLASPHVHMCSLKAVFFVVKQQHLTRGQTVQRCERIHKLVA